LQNPTGKIYLFFDEIQTIPRWEKWLKYYYDQRKGEIKFFITGSNSQLLSSEFATLLSGRVIEKRLYPFSLSEILTFHGVKHENIQKMIIHKSQILYYLDSYLEYGGMPELLAIDLVETKREVLLSYFNTIIYKDIIPRFSLRADKTVYKLALYLIANATSLMNIKRLSEHLSIAKREDTKSYIDYLQQALIISVVSRFDYSLKTQLYSQKKSYVIDAGFINLLPIRFSQNKGKLLENCVFLHLAKKYQEVFYFMSNQSECDFIAVQSMREFICYQVCYELNEENRKREIKGALTALEKTNAKQCFIITYDQEEEIENNARKIKVIPFWKWSLMS
jgi:predicted AAA+ superfamily ATPase